MSVPPAIDAALLALGREPGQSSVVRALENAIDRAVLSAFGKSPMQESDIGKALDSLRLCLTYARSGAGGPGDARVVPKLETLTALLEGLLAPPVVAPPAPAPVAALKEAEPSSERPVVPTPPATSTLGRPYRMEEIISTILANLAGLYARRCSMLANVVAPWRDFRDVDSQIQNATWSLSWIEGAVLQPARATFEAADDEPERFAATLALLHVGGADAVLSFLSASSGKEATGARPPAVLDASARVSVQDTAAARIRAGIEERRRPIPDGGWFYFGQPQA